MDSQPPLGHSLVSAQRPEYFRKMMKENPTERDPSEYDGEDCLRNDRFLPHALTVANNSYAWHASKLYLDVLGFGVNETRILSILYEYGELQAWRICDILSMNKATVSQSLKTLEKQELIEIERRREGRFARPTKKSEPAHRKIVQMARAREEILLKGFSEEERSKFIEFLNRFHRNIPESLEYTEKHFLNKD
ncbi:MarR family winged helix-turn-helix transcriptional regulator [Altericroceibacterium endophyticum]|uniref:ArsR family transcriptional regulator n=1 Tax=Altericroceibacterium endophyticum TaxID=1808508 RepID=A0A6I4T793_9SPHN|nr:ArsR family transcriptional regulator [Altericroceibacterium endophyticum]MXO66677.1 ArsR family transcriptional regulator [Altericroceibacterium endophyticum]